MLSSNKLLYLLAFIEGATVMAVELLSARMLAPYFGTGIHVWGAIIGTTVASLAMGYFLGGYLAERGANRQKLFFIFLLASLFMMVMPTEAKNLIGLFSETEPLISVVIISFILLIPCLGLLGTTPVLIIHLLTESLEETGQTAGNVYSLSTIGGIIGTFLVGFYIIPEFGITTPTVVLAMIPGILAITLLVMSRQVIALSALVVVLFGYLSTKTKTPRSNVKILHNSEGLLGQVMIADAILPGMANRILFVNRMGQTFVDINTGKSRWSYPSYVTALCSTYPKKTKALLLGLGGGSVGKNMIEILDFDLTIVELDKRMAKLGKKFFGLPSSVNPIVDDARHFLETTEQQYDIIIIDVFKGEVPPAHVLSKECFETVKTKLTAKGLLIINFNGFLEGLEGRAGRSLYNTLVAADFHTKILPTYEQPLYRNCLFISQANPINLHEPRFPLRNGNTPIDFSAVFLTDAETNFPEAPIFLDDQSLLDHYNVAAAQIWRREYKKHYTDMFSSKGIELFK